MRSRSTLLSGRLAALALALLVAPGGAAAEQDAGASPAGAPQQPAALQVGPEPAADAPGLRFPNPYEAYEAGLYDQALQGFVDLQVERPEDPEIALNVGAAQYGLRDYSRADQAFARAALGADPGLREEALYNLGNSAFRQGRLQEAVELYKAALEIDPEDEDAKFNLEFVRNEIRRRHEEARERQQEQQEAGQEQQEAGQDQQDPQSQQDQEGQRNQQDAPASPPDAGPDSDRDGLPDEVERTGENPTDPENPDSDADGLPDGTEDANRNGRVDPGETDPNQADSDGDGVPDAAETTGSGPAGEGQEQETSAGLTPEEAERYLQALQEGRPVRQLPQGGRGTRTEKDW